MASDAEPTTRSGPEAPPGTSAGDVARAIHELAENRERLRRTSVGERIALAEACAEGVWTAARQWVEAACEAKGIAPDSPCRAEEILSGPVPTLRYLRLVIRSLRDIQRQGRPGLPGRARRGPDGRLRVPVFPARGLFDHLAFLRFRATAWMGEGITEDNLADHQALHYRQAGRDPARIVLVLGAGNVSSIPATDAFSKLFQEGALVLLKMSPVNAYLGPVFQQALAPLVEAGFLRIIYGGAEAGALAAHHASVDAVHLTGSVESHDGLVWGPRGEERVRRKHAGQPLLAKPVTCELGNVSPWIVVPGAYTPRQLAFQAENVAGSVTNNVSFMCVATKVLVTWKRWPDRQRFLDLLEQTLAAVPRRVAYYPGAAERYRRFAGEEAGEGPPGTLPWKLVRDVPPEPRAAWFEEESFAPVFVETALDAASEEDFLSQAVDFANERLNGTLAAAITLPPGFRRPAARERLLESCLARLRYGSVAINHWPGLVYGMMSPPWGGFPGGTPADPQSGIGWVHNTYMLEGVEKTVLEGPLSMALKPLWFPTHPHPEPASWALLALYHRPCWPRVLKLAAAML